MRRIAVFARWPQVGRVKTRLSPALPPVLACDLHRAMILDAVAIAAASGTDERILYWADPPASAVEIADGSAAPRAGEPRGIEAPGFDERIQRGADLGERMERAMSDLLRAPDDRAVVIGADCPDLDPAIVDSAFEALDRHDLVLGPTRDGGYYLIALSRPTPDLFRDVAWSTDRVFEQTRERAAGLGLGVHGLATLDDLDTPADLARWIAARAVAPRTGARHTLERLEAMGLMPRIETRPD